MNSAIRATVRLALHAGAKTFVVYWVWRLSYLFVCNIVQIVRIEFSVVYIPLLSNYPTLLHLYYY